jgi:copper(I)-binding protein
MTFSSRILLAAAMASPFALSACADPQPLYVDQAWIRLSPNPESPAAGYFTIHGGPEDVSLRGVTTEAALRVELHESLMQNGMMTMKPIESVTVPAKTQVKFAPGGKHLMLFGVNPAVVKAGKLQLTMVFSNGDRIIVDAVIQKPTADAKAGKDDGTSAMDHAHEGNTEGRNTTH